MAGSRCRACGARTPSWADTCPTCGAAHEPEPVLAARPVTPAVPRPVPSDRAAAGPDASPAPPGAGSAPTGPGAPAPAEPAPGGRRVLAGAALVALVVVGLVLTGVTSGGDDTPEATATTARRRPTTTAAPRPPRTTVAPTPTTLPQFAPLLPAAPGLELVAVLGERLVAVDLARGATRSLTEETFDDGAMALLPTPHGVLVWAQGRGSGPRLVLVGDQGAGRRLADAGELLVPTPDRRAVWVAARDGAAPVVRRIDLADPDAPDAEVRIPAQAWPVGATDDGLLLQTRGDGVYLQPPDGPARRVAGGTLVAADGERMAVAGCDEALHCQLVVHQPGRPPQPLADLAGPDGDGDGDDHEYGHGLFSPDGRHLAVPVADVATGRQQLAVHDLAEGRRHLLEDPLAFGSAFGGGFAWSPDSRWLVARTLSGRMDVVALDATSGLVVPLDLGRGELSSAIGLRAATGPAT